MLVGAVIVASGGSNEVAVPFGGPTEPCEEKFAS
jgi:hypothetical protein